MNGLDDLRRTLDRHADDLADGADHVTVERRVAVHHRIGVAKRRRRAAAAGGLAAVVAAVAGVALSPGRDLEDPDPALEVVGVPVPDTMANLGFTYAAADAVTGTGHRVTLRLKPADEPRLVSWATSSSDDAVTVSGDDGDMEFRSEAPDFTDFVLVHQGIAATVVVTSDHGTPGLATYELTDERPAGYTDKGTTFRQEVADGHLLAATVGDPGEAELSLPVVADGPGVRYVVSCADGPGRLEMRQVFDDGYTQSTTSCGQALPVDGATGDPANFGSTPEEDASLTVRIVETGTNSLIVDSDLVVAVAAYSLDDDPGARAALLPAEVEFGGRGWERVEVSDAAAAASLAVDAPTGQGVVLVVAHANAGDGRRVIISAGRGEETRVDDRSPATVTQLVDGGTRVRLRTLGGAFARYLAVGFYRAAD